MTPHAAISNCFEVRVSVEPVVTLLRNRIRFPNDSATHQKEPIGKQFKNLPSKIFRDDCNKLIFHASFLLIIIISRIYHRYLFKHLRVFLTLVG